MNKNNENKKKNFILPFFIIFLYELFMFSFYYFQSIFFVSFGVIYSTRIKIQNSQPQSK
jgi:hypothetical protein